MEITNIETLLKSMIIISFGGMFVFSLINKTNTYRLFLVAFILSISISSFVDYQIMGIVLLLIFSIIPFFVWFILNYTMPYIWKKSTQEITNCEMPQEYRASIFKVYRSVWFLE